HYSRWLNERFPDEVGGFYRLFTANGMNDEPGGDTGAPEVAFNPVPREHYHTDWVADRTIAYLDSLDANDDWFVWMSFPDPHHPWDPPQSELGRVDWRQLDLPDGYPGSDERCREILAAKPAHWLGYYEGTFANREGGPTTFVPAKMTHDQLREINAIIHVENELIDEACGRVLDAVARRGWDDETDVFFTTDHGELQGDFGLLFKGAYHCDALMHIPLIWRPAGVAHTAPLTVPDPVGQIDLAPTFCAIAGLPVPDWVQGATLPTAPRQFKREEVITEWDSQFESEDLHLRSMYRDGWLVTAYEPGGGYEGTEGELYSLFEDPLQWHNLWDDASYRATRDDLVADLYDSLPPARAERLNVEAPV
ncbi:MAG TPA: sulfatase-like hydrolase/transferase, partial [Acidimicrobiales bacterium]|nr:sulfatase-like hydrolase/transferase [Acidimicrobiales bacterium]